MKLFRRSRDETDYIVALDVGTEFIKALIAHQTDNGDLEIIGAGRARQKSGSMFGGAIADINSVVRSAEIALADAEEQAGVQARRVVIGIAGEFVKGQTSTIRYRRPDPDQQLSEAEMQLIIDKVEQRAGNKARRQIGFETGNPSVEIKLVNAAIVSIHIDGYKVSNPIGFQGRDVAVQIYTAFAPMVHIGALERVAMELDLDLVAVAAEPFAVARAVLGDQTNSNYTAIICDIGGGSTDMAVINDGGVEGTRMFGVAGSSFTKTIADDLGISYNTAEQLKLNLDDPKIRPNVRSAINESINSTLSVWLSGVQLALSEFTAVDHLPSRILLCGGGASLQPLVDKLSEPAWHSDLPFARPISVKHILPDDVLGIVDKSGRVTDFSYITAMGLLRVGCDTIGISSTDKPTASIKQKLDNLTKI